MRKNIFILTFILAFTLACPVDATASDTDTNGMEVSDKNINIVVEQSTVRITGASGLTLEVVSLTGRKVTTVKIESTSQRVELNIPKGCYILKLGKVVRKVSIC